MATENLKIHFIGIGGIGVSALAQYYLAKGHKVSGSDLVGSEITEALKKKGAKIRIGKSVGTWSKCADLVVYSPAVREDNVELKAAKKAGIKCLSYPQALGELTKKHYTIAVSGTHGKSTTTAMVALILIKAGLDPTVIIGTKLKEFGDSNFRMGKSEYLVIEADEHFASFLNYWPRMIVLTNIEADHLDYYKKLENIIKTFKKYVGHLPKDGVLIANRDDKNIKQITKNWKQEIKYYSLKQAEAKKIRNILKIPGEHNVCNALAALAAARVLKVPDSISFRALSGYRGAWRRFEISKITWNKKPITIVSDYGHHPTKVRVTLLAAREKWPQKKICCVYQPHQYQRTYYLFRDFVKVFKSAAVDEIIITDIFDVAGREEKAIKQKVNSEKLVRAVKKDSVIYLPKAGIMDYLKKNLKGGEVVIIMGAGDIYNLAASLTEKKNKKKI
ncbi:MAG: Mur ligase domain-containing protein [Candidatus Pacebacteria bacterium]|nr:Mur ligase domain-containing protein [Candidatus Paceibacterota bacterium]